MDKRKIVKTSRERGQEKNPDKVIGSHIQQNQLGNPALPRSLIVTHTVFPRLVLNNDFSYFSTHSTQNLKIKLRTFEVNRAWGSLVMIGHINKQTKLTTFYIQISFNIRNYKIYTEIKIYTEKDGMYIEPTYTVFSQE